MAQDRRDVFGGRASAGGVYAPDPGDDDSFGDGPSSGPRGPLILALGSAIIIILAVVIWNAYRDGVKSGDADRLPVIEGDARPAKVPGDSPGAVSSSASAVAAIPEAVIEPPAGTGQADARNAVTKQLEGIVPDIAIAAPDGPNAGEEVPPSSALRRADAAQQGEGRDDLGKRVVEPGKQTAPVAGIQTPTANTSPAAPTTGNGIYLVQLGSVRSADAAEMVWAKAVKAAPALFATVQKEVEQVDLGPQGIFFRVRAGPFANRSAADGFCNALKTAGESCFATIR